MEILLTWIIFHQIILLLAGPDPASSNGGVGTGPLAGRPAMHPAPRLSIKRLSDNTEGTITADMTILLYI